MDEIIYINEEDGVKRVLNNTKLYTKLLAKFRAETKLDDLIAFAEAQDWEKAQGAVHTIKGLAANLSLTQLYNHSLDVETQVKGRSLRSESLENMKACFEETLIRIDGVIAKNV